MSDLVRANLPERFASRLPAETPPDACWLWAGAISPQGYGRLNIEYAHRLAYEQFVGPIPDGLHIDHLCKVRSCVNPAHLEAVPQRVNTLRGDAPGAIAWRTNVCQRGHAFDEHNTYWRKDGGGRQCRACIRIRSRRRARKMRELAA